MVDGSIWNCVGSCGWRCKILRRIVGRTDAATEEGEHEGGIFANKGRDLELWGGSDRSVDALEASRFESM